MPTVYDKFWSNIQNKAEKMYEVIACRCVLEPFNLQTSQFRVCDASDIVHNTN